MTLPHLPPRTPDSHKGDFGSVLLIGGSHGMTGAVALAGMAALRSGAGLVRLATPAVCQDVVASFETSYMTAALACDEAGRIGIAARNALEELAAKATVIGCGPGLGRSEELTELVGWLYTHLKQPAVFDADALNALSTQPQLLARAGGPRILTPHPGEFQRLIEVNERLPRDECERRAVELAQRCDVVIVLKGHRTLITDGRQQYHNTTGNPGMATGGTGDVLTGVTTALLGQKLTPLDAARLAAHIHGLAGDLAAAELGQVSLIASDLLDYLPRSFQQNAD
ncbi:MAG TPA: NAD(P)H-hydrate dehydratase [Pirellulales bacterium]|nr:NAD(P)H-hydrate dehydratase [Pirellulales bacterium]